MLRAVWYWERRPNEEDREYTSTVGEDKMAESVPAACKRRRRLRLLVAHQRLQLWYRRHRDVCRQGC